LFVSIVQLRTFRNLVTVKIEDMKSPLAGDVNLAIVKIL